MPPQGAEHDNPRQRIQALVREASAAEASGNGPAALALLRQAQALAPKHQGLVPAMVRLLLARGDEQEAFGLAEALVAADPASVPGLIALASCQRHCRQWSEAIASYRRAAALDPDHPGVQAALATLSHRPVADSGHSKAAVAALIAKAEEAYAAQDLAKALAHVQQALALQPGDPDLLAASARSSWQQLAWASRRWRQGDTEGALKELDSVLDSDLDLSELDLRPAVGAGADRPDGEWCRIVWQRLQACNRPLEAERWRRLARESGCTLPAPTQRPVLRLVHHLACSGGTLISKCLAALPRVALLSELNPRSRLAPEFLPAAPLRLLEKAHRSLTPGEIAAAFLAEFAQVLEIARADDLDLVLRDHSHSDFCVATEPSNAPMLRGLLEDQHPLLSVLTLRHPLDCWLGLMHASWQGQMQPASLLEYCRRHQAFLDAYPGVPWFHYEDFVLKPQAGLEELCDRLCLDCDHGALERFAGISMSGASGRGGDRIEPRLRRPLPEPVQLELEDPATAQALAELCERLHYQPGDPFA